MTTFAQAQQRAQAHTPARISHEFLLFVVLFGLAFFLRITHLEYNTVFVDEAIYATIGREFVAGVDLQKGTGWLFGSQMYPSLAAITDDFGGLVAVRGLSAILTSIAAFFVFLTTLRLFGKHPALWALLIFGLTGSSISVGQFATYDALGLPFLALSMFLIVAALLASSWRQNVLLTLGGLAFALSFLSKYIALLYLPTLLFVGGVLFLYQGKSVRPLLIWFLIPAALVIAAFIVPNWVEVSDVFSGRHSTQRVDATLIIKLIIEEIGFALPLALAGLVSRPAALLPEPSNRILKSKWVLRAAAILIVGSALALPVFQLLTSNIRSLEKHSVYALALLAPLAGQGVALLVDKVRLGAGLTQPRLRAAGAVVTIAGLIWFTNYSLDRNWGFQNSWPNISGAVHYLRENGLNADSLVLASASATYEYYFDFDIYTSRKIWYNTWWMLYKGLEGEAAMKAAIIDRALDFVILDNYYTPAINAVLEPVLEAAGYTIGYEENTALPNGAPIFIRIYVPPDQEPSA